MVSPKKDTFASTTKNTLYRITIQNKKAFYISQINEKKKIFKYFLANKDMKPKKLILKS